MAAPAVSVLFLLFLPSAPASYNLDVHRPVIYQLPTAERGTSYFGMSVAIRPKAATLGDSTWSIQVGAPKGNMKGLDVREPGTIFRCHTYGPCSEYPLERTAVDTGGKGNYAYKDKKDGAWIGASMGLADSDSVERSVVCGHRWINQNRKNPENIDVTYLMTGACYLQNLNGTTETPTKKLLPLVDSEKIYTPKPYVVDMSTYHWGLGQAGASLLLTDEPSDVVLGAPGLTHWIGSVLRIDSQLKMIVGNFAKTDIPKRNRYTYLGYSLAAGRFYEDKILWLATGAPRSAHYHGEVFVFQYKGATEDIYIQSNLVGTTFGEYFGYALATGDVNGDGLDDLLVGAPTYSKKDPDEGRLYVYLGNPQANYLQETPAINGKKSGGRFGSSIASFRDLDQDGYDDVAVGAPYEDDGSGAIYVFRGHPSGLQTDRARRISAEELYPHLRGFGVSISNAVDVDGNGYRDILVGSYLSDHAVLLRSRPIISLQPKIKVENMTLIDRRAPFFNISVCSRYTGSNAPSSADVIRMVEVDPVHERGSLLRLKGVSKVIRMRANEITCEILTFSFRNVLKKNYLPVEVVVKNELPPCGQPPAKPLLVWKESRKKTKTGKQKVEEEDEEEKDFRKWCPVGKSAETSKEIPFAGECGEDNICSSDLNLSCVLPQLRSGEYVLGSSEILSLTMELKNLGEPAYETKMKIWSNVKLRLVDRKLQDELSRNTHWIDMEAIFYDFYQGNFSFSIDFEDLKKNMASTLSLIVEVSTSSVELNFNNNKCRFSAKLLADASLTLYSSSSASSIYVSRKDMEQLINITHYYEVQKTGVTPVTDAHISLHIPYFFELEFLTAEVETAGWMHFSSNYERHAIIDADDFEINDDSLQASVASTENCPPANRTLFLNCSTEDVHCRSVKVFFSHGIPTGMSSYVKILIKLNATALDIIKGEKDIIHISTFAVLRYLKPLEASAREMEATASVTLYNEDKEKAVQGYVIGLSVLMGILLLSIIVVALAKSNFFVRAKKKELEALKEAEASFIYFATGSVSTECTTLED